MIILHRLKDARVAINPDLVERVEANPDTVITLVDGKKLLVTESLEDVIALITDYRAYVLARSAAVEILEVPRPDLAIIPGGDAVIPLDPEAGR
ncbi:MAG: flagellar FlbD family protein [Acidimicrobiales bacterium]